MKKNVLQKFHSFFTLGACSCRTCKAVVSSNQIRSLHSNMTAEIKALDRSDPDSLETWIKQKLVAVPESHQLVREVQHGLVCLFKLDNPELMNNSQLLRKSVLCKWLKKGKREYSYSSCVFLSRYLINGP